jgi:protein subunit release factor B
MKIKRQLRMGMSTNKEILFSVTAKDCDWSYTKGTGAGGQKKNKTSSAVHCTHRASGAHGYSEETRSQSHNKRDAFLKMVETSVFKKWHQLEISRLTGAQAELDRQVAQSLKKIKIEVQQDGKWTEVKEVDLKD